MPLNLHGGNRSLAVTIVRAIVDFMLGMMSPIEYNNSFTSEVVGV